MTRQSIPISSEVADLIATLSPPYDEQRRWYEAVDSGVKDAARDLLVEAIDMHLHCDPSPALRVMDAFQAAEEASAAGMRAIVLKDHLTGMEDSAWLARDHAETSTPFEVFGSLWLNNHVGGWNVFAVDKAVIFGARLIGAPTLAARGEVARAAAQGVHPAERLVKNIAPRKAKTIETLDEDGHVRPEVVECLERIAEAGNVVLGTGHLDTEEAFAVVRAAHQCGVEHICMTHAFLTAPATAEEYRELCRHTGAVCEFTASQILKLRNAVPPLMRTLGLEHVTLSSDAGLILTPSGVEYYQYNLAALLEAGMTEAELSAIAHTTPAGLLGIGNA